MTRSTPTHLVEELPRTDHVGVARWFAFCLVLLAVCTVALVYVATHMNVDAAGWDERLETWHDAQTVWKQQWGRSLSAWTQLWQSFLRVFEVTPAHFKLLFLLTYLMICTTLTPFPANAVVAAMAMQEVAIGGLWSTTFLVAVVGATGSTIANLTDYAIFTLLLRRRRVARIRETKTFQIAQKWFARGPFFILALFNLLPIPVDVIRLLAITCRYPRPRFAAANFVGRFARYAVFAWFTYYFHLSWVAPVSLLALAALLAAGKGVASIISRFRKNRAGLRGARD